MQLVGDRDTARFSCEISAVCADPHPTNGRPAYRDVLAWVVDAIVGVLIARLGAAGQGEKFILEFRSTAGGDVDVESLPPSERWMLRTVSAFLTQNPAEGRRLLTAAEHFDITLRAETLADAIIWLDFVLDIDLPDPPDVTTT